MKDLATSLVALLVSEACDIGLTPVVNPAHEALTRARLVHVDQYRRSPNTGASPRPNTCSAWSIRPTTPTAGK
ncbi:hypothetical protein OG214_35345 [Streptomyces sp. NBC_00872]|nr:hypothetical protein OG214_35345 [Streptomyces sp. NBC_00872]